MDAVWLMRDQAAVMSASRDMLAFSRPTEDEYRSVRDWLFDTKPVYDKELQYIRRKDDIVTLRPDREHAFLDTTIERVLFALSRPFPFSKVRSHRSCEI